MKDYIEERAIDIAGYIIENNATGQFANLLQMTFGIKLPKRILKYNGEPFFIDELEVKFTEVRNG